jgi:hypothetical protein
MSFFFFLYVQKRQECHLCRTTRAKSRDVYDVTTSSTFIHYISSVAHACGGLAMKNVSASPVCLRVLTSRQTDEMGYVLFTCISWWTALRPELWSHLKWPFGSLRVWWTDTRSDLWPPSPPGNRRVPQLDRTSQFSQCPHKKALLCWLDVLMCGDRMFVTAPAWLCKHVWAKQYSTLSTLVPSHESTRYLPATLGLSANISDLHLLWTCPARISACAGTILIVAFRAFPQSIRAMSD